MFSSRGTVKSVMENGTDCIILAAGTSSRMKKWKMLLPFKGSTVLQNSINNALEVFERIILVTGYRGDRLKSIFRNSERIKIAHNTGYINGMLTSIKRGIKEVATGHFFISHGDLPLINPDTYHSLLKHKGVKAVIPVHKGRRGHPVLLPGTLIPVILKATVKQSLRDILGGYPKEFIEVADPGIYMDVDTEEDYRKLISNHFKEEHE